MIQAVGIDSVDITRFEGWTSRPDHELKKIFSRQEIAYCLQNQQKAPERFAARFAVKEALFKALSDVLPNNELPFLTVCKNVSIEQEENGNPQISINWQNITPNKPSKTTYKSIVSITHTKSIATAIVIIVENP